MLYTQTLNTGFSWDLMIMGHVKIKEMFNYTTASVVLPSGFRTERILTVLCDSSEFNTVALKLKRRSINGTTSEPKECRLRNQSRVNALS